MQFSDTHIAEAHETHSVMDSAAFLAEAIAFANTLRPQPEYALVTGDLVNGGRPSEYARFTETMRALHVPYFALMGNHDERDALRAGLAPSVYGHAAADRIEFAVDNFTLRTIALDPNPHERTRWPVARLESKSLDWLEATLAAAPEQPTLLAIHQPPFRTGLHYFDVFGYRGARRLRAIVRAAPQVGRVVSGHIHCVKTYVLGTTLFASAPSTAPQFVPEFFERHVLGLRHEIPGFTVHDWSAESGFVSTVYRRTAPSTYLPHPPLALATRR